MLVFLLQNWQLKRSFEPIDGGYVFRLHRWSEGFFFSEGERDEALQLFRKSYWRRTLRFWIICIPALVVYFLLILLISLYWDLAFDVDNRFFIKLAVWVAFLAIIIATLHLHYQLLNIPLKLAEGREAIKPKRISLDTFIVYWQGRSWTKIALSTLLIGLLGNLTFQAAFKSTIGISIWTLYFGFCALALAANVYFKLQAPR